MTQSDEPRDLGGDSRMREGAREMIAGGGDSLEPHFLIGAETVSANLAEESRIAVLEKARFLGEDRFRLLRHHLKEIRSSRPLQTIIVTSALPQDGKSTIAINTATALVDDGRQNVLLVEADLHCPSVGKTLGLDPVAGTAECLELGHDPLMYIRKVSPLGFYCLLAGSAAAHPTDLIQSDKFPRFVESLRGKFDWIIIDTPPVLPVPDTISMWKHVDGVLVVVRAERTSRDQADEAIKLAGPERLAAVIFNGSVEATESYYKYSSYYGAKYGYSGYRA